MSDKPWTTKEIKEAMRLFVKFDMEYCVEQTGRTARSIKKMAVREGVVTNRPQTPRSLYAQDIAIIMELDEAGQDRKDIAKYFRIAVGTVKHALCQARKHGFDAYPMRSL